MVRRFSCGSTLPCPEVPCLIVLVHGVMQVTAQMVSWLKLMQQYGMRGWLFVVFEL